MANIQLRTTILNILKEADKPLPPLEISKKAGLKTSKDVNPILYSMLSNKQVEKIADEGGRNPRWVLLDSNTPETKLRDEVLSLLKTSQEPLSPSSIQTQLGQPIAKKNLNSILYSLQKEDLLIKTANPDGTNPKWSLK